MKEHLYILSIAAVSTTDPSKTNVGLLTRGAKAPRVSKRRDSARSPHMTYCLSRKVGPATMLS